MINDRTLCSRLARKTFLNHHLAKANYQQLFIDDPSGLKTQQVTQNQRQWWDS